MEPVQPLKNSIGIINHFSLWLIIMLSYSIFFWLDFDTIFLLGYEDGFFEYLTAILFFIASILMLRTGIKSKNWWFIGLFVLLFVGAGEEISWGQRLIGIETPDELKKVNVQGEINLHNLEFFNRENFDKSVKTGWKKFLTVNTIYRAFIMVYGVIIPLLALFLPIVNRLLQRLSIPVIHLQLGIYFFFSWMAFRVMNICCIGSDDFFAAEEIFESLTAWVWFFAAIHFMINFQKTASKKEL